MATKNIVSLRVATDPTYGDVDSTTGLPNDPATGTLYAAVVSDKSQLLIPGDPILTDVNGQAKSGLYSLPPETDTLLDGSGNPIKRRAGQVVVTMPVKGCGDGTAFDDYSKLPLYMLGNSALEDVENSTVGSDVVATIGTVNSHTATDATKFTVGNNFKVVIAGRVEFARVTNIVGSVITYTPALSTALTSSQAVYPMRTLFVPSDTVPTTIASATLILNGVGWEARCSGCDVMNITYNYSKDTKRLEATYTIDCAYIDYQTTSDKPVDPTYADGGMWKHEMAYCIFSSTGGTKESPVAAPAALARTRICLSELTLSVTITRSASDCGETILGRSSHEITDVKVEGTLTFGNTTVAYDDDLFDGTMRNLLIGFNSGQANTSGEGGCFMLPSAVLTNDPQKLDAGMDHYRTMIGFANGPWQGDNGATDPANNSFTWSFGDIF